MKNLNTSDRLKQIMKERNIRQVDILNACKPFCKRYNVKLEKNDLSQYISGKVQPGQDKLSILGMALNVNEVWLMGYDVPSGKTELHQIERSPNCELFEKCYDKEAFHVISLFIQLDTLDQGRVIRNIEEMLKSDKYTKIVNTKHVMQAARDGTVVGEVETTAEEETKLTNTPLLNFDL